MPPALQKGECQVGTGREEGQALGRAGGRAREQLAHTYIHTYLLVSCAHLDKTWLAATPAQRLGFVEPTATSLLLIMVAFRVYHGMKARRVAGLSTSDPSVECSGALDLINHFLSEIPARLLAPIF